MVDSDSEDEAPSSEIIKTKSVSLQYQGHEYDLLTFIKKRKPDNGKGRETASRHLQSQNKNSDSNAEEDEGDSDTESADSSEDEGKSTTVLQSLERKPVRLFSHVAASHH